MKWPLHWIKPIVDWCFLFEYTNAYLSVEARKVNTNTIKYAIHCSVFVLNWIDQATQFKIVEGMSAYDLNVGTFIYCKNVFDMALPDIIGTEKSNTICILDSHLIK